MDMDMEQGWDVVYQRILKLRKVLEGDSDEQILTDELIMEIYTIVYKISEQRPFMFYSPLLYDRYKASLQEYATLILQDLINKDGELMLRELAKRWETYCVMVQTLSDWFRILDRFINLLNLLPLREVGLICFREHAYHEMKANAKNAVLSLIHSEREGAQIDHSLLKSVLNFFVKIGMDDELILYKNDFETHLLEDTRNYYSGKAALWIPVDSFSDYMHKAEDCLKREEDRVAHYLHPSSKQILLEVVRNELLSHYPTQLLENEISGCPAFVREDKKDDLLRMYRLFSKISNGLEPISKSFIEQLTIEGSKIVKQAEVDVANYDNQERMDTGGMQQHAFVRKVIELHDKYMEYVEDAFQNNSIFTQPFKKAFQVICDKRVGQSTFAEMLAIFCAHLLSKKGGGKLSDSDVENMLEKVVKLLLYVGDKDVFAQVYTKKLALRLLFDESINFSMEENILPKLKQHYGHEFISNMNGMIKDWKLAEDGESEFENYLQSENIDLGLQFRVKVLNSRSWPTFQFSKPNLPSEIVNCAEVFKAYYCRENICHKLTWIYSMGTCNIIGKFDKMKIEMTATTYQAITLLLFNDSDKLSYEEIKSQLNLTDEDVAKQLHSLTCLNYKILLKQPNTKIVAKSDIFEYIPNFTNKLKRIQIPYPRLEEQKKKKSNNYGEDSKKYVIDALIIRIMKSRKVLNESDLISKCVDELGRMFKPDVSVIGKQIESLIGRDFLERDEANSHALKYVP